MFKLFRRRGTALHTMDLVLLISAVGAAFAIARGPITRYLGNWLVLSTRGILQESSYGAGLQQAYNPNDDIEKVTDAFDKDHQGTGYDTDITYGHSFGSGESKVLAGDLKRILDDAVTNADLGGKYTGQEIGWNDPEEVTTEDFQAPDRPEIPNPGAGDAIGG